EVGGPEVGGPEVGGPEVGGPAVGGPEVGWPLGRDAGAEVAVLAGALEDDGGSVLVALGWLAGLAPQPASATSIAAAMTAALGGIRLMLATPASCRTGASRNPSA
ncbi:MAG: hypothetical protein ACRDP5_16790, partial [Streptosporangiaceae bacterium]